MNNSGRFYDYLGLDAKPVVLCEEDLKDNPKPGERIPVISPTCFSYANAHPYLPDEVCGGTCAVMTGTVKAKYGWIDVPNGGCCPKNYHKVYMRRSKKVGDCHFYRQDNDGTWSHKLGDEFPVQTGIQGDIRVANHDYSQMGGHDYDEECGFFCSPTTLSPAIEKAFRKQIIDAMKSMILSLEAYIGQPGQNDTQLKAQINNLQNEIKRLEKL